MHRLLRSARSITRWLSQPPRSISEIIQHEFGGFQKSISAYWVDESCATQVAAEHTAGCHSNPGKTLLIDVGGFNSVHHPLTNAQWPSFAFTRNAHHSIKFGGLADMEHFVQTILGDLHNRRIDIKRPTLMAYTRTNATTPEWSAYRPNQYVEEWKKFLTP